MPAITIKQILDGKWLAEIPVWFKELIESQKCNWVPDSKGGEPNCKKETLL